MQTPPTQIIGVTEMIVNVSGRPANMMNMLDSVITCFRKYVDFEGRASRSEYWWFYLFTWILSLGGSVMDNMTDSGELFYWITAIATFTPAIAAGARRLHDVNKSGWWQLISGLPFVGIIGLIFLLIWWCTEGEKKKNKYGPPLKLKR